MFSMSYACTNERRAPIWDRYGVQTYGLTDALRYEVARCCVCPFFALV
jgi:hypothetical protein